jgi:mercuric ion transport protein
MEDRRRSTKREIARQNVTGPIRQVGPESDMSQKVGHRKARHVMTRRPLLKTGISGSVIAAVCCFTPLLVVLLGAVGLSAWLGWLDYVLFPALAVFLAITAYALLRRRRA